MIFLSEFRIFRNLEFQLTISDYNSICSNAIRYIQAGTDGYGVYGSGNYNAVLGNTLDNCVSGFIVGGTGNNISHNTMV